MATPSLRLSSLFGRTVTDADGVVIGHVHDVRLRRDGPIIPNFGPALRVDQLLVGRASLAYRLGLNRADITGPWPLNVFGRRARRRVRVVPWDGVHEVGEALQTSRRVDELRGLDE